MKLHLYSSIFLLTFPSSITALPASTTGISETANYDDLPPALLLTPIPTYQNLTYTDFTYASQINNSIGLVTSSSPPNRVGTGITPTQTLTPRAPYEAFALQEFFYGCVARAGQAAVGQTVACFIAVKGYEAGTGRLVASTVLRFRPRALVETGNVPMVRAGLEGGFGGRLGKVTLEVSLPLLTVALVDDLGYLLFTG